MDIQITTSDRHADFDLLDASEIGPGKEVDIGQGVIAHYRGGLMRKAGDFPAVFEFAIATASGVSATLIANAVWEWLRSRLKKRPEQIAIDRVQVDFEEGEIKRVIIERLTRGGDQTD